MALAAGLESISASLPTNYEYYTSGGIKHGLNADQSYFTLNDKLIRIYSGAMHYFRVPRKYWRDRLKKIRAAGLNTVETYVPWNLHEPESGVYDFGNGGSEMEEFLHVEEFLQTAQEEDLFVILRPGPYICSEFNFGGFPSWLLRENPIGFRSSETNYMKYVARFFNILLPILAAFQFTNGGPVIVFQLENEYGYQWYNDHAPDKIYLEELHQMYVNHSIRELLVTSDSPVMGTVGTIPGTFLLTANFGNDADNFLDELEKLQPGRPIMVMEYWIGWFDYWGATHSGNDYNSSKAVYESILNHKNASVNIYMFHGGTNFWFNSGGTLTNLLTDNSEFQAITTSYDYDAPISEDGTYKEKYYMVKELIEASNPVKTLIPEVPTPSEVKAYGSLKVSDQIGFKNFIANNAPVILNSSDVISMEKLPINGNSGQSNGYILYRKENIDLEAGAVLKIGGHVCDTVLVLLNGKLVGPKKLNTTSDLDGFGFWRLKDSNITITNEAVTDATVDLLVENWGRTSGGYYFQYNITFKGLWQDSVYVNDQKVSDWKIVPLEFKKSWVSNLKGWETYKEGNTGPTIYGALLNIPDIPSDTYINMEGWGKGLVFVNSFLIGRYSALGPQQTLYLPGAFLESGNNNITIFEHFRPSENGLINFSLNHIFASIVN